MSFILKIFLKVLLYSIIVIFVKSTIGKIQEPSAGIKQTELGERFIDWKIFSNIYMIVGIGFTCILIFALNMTSNYNVLVIALFILLIVLFFLMGFLYGRVYVKVGKDRIYWRKMNGKEYNIRYEDITSHVVDESGNVKLYQNNKCILAFATGTHKVFVTEVLKNHKVPMKDNGNTPLILEPKKGYIILYGVGFLCSAILWLLCTGYGVFAGFLIFLINSVILFILFITSTRHKIVVEKNKIIEKKLLRNKSIEFVQVEYLSLKKDNEAEIICIHSNAGGMIKIPKSYKNVEMFEVLIAKQHWKWK